MKKGYGIILLVFFILVGKVTYAQETSLTIYVDNQLANPGKPYFSVSGKMKNNEVFVPTLLLSYMNHNLFEDETNRTIVINSGDLVVPMGVDKKQLSKEEIDFNRQVSVKGEKILLSQPVYFVKGVALSPDLTYVPLQDLCVLFEYTYEIKGNNLYIDTHGKKPLAKQTHENYFPQDNAITRQTRYTQTRKPGTSFKEDLVYISSILPQHTGLYTSNFSCIEGDKTKGERIIQINRWESKSGYYEIYNKFKDQLNLIEFLKYFSAYYTDGIRIYAYIDNVLQKNQVIKKETLTFGKTTVKIDAYIDAFEKYNVDISFYDNHNVNTTGQSETLYKKPVTQGQTYSAKDILNDTVFGNPNSFLLQNEQLVLQDLSIYIHPQRNHTIELEPGVPLLKEFGFLRYADESRKRDEMVARTYGKLESLVSIWFIDELGNVIDVLTPGMWASPVHIEAMRERSACYGLINKCSYIVFTKYGNNKISIMENPYKGDGHSLPVIVVGDWGDYD